jgi:hypothetical protein
LLISLDVIDDYAELTSVLASSMRADTVLVDEFMQFGGTDARVGHNVFTRAPTMGFLMIVVLPGMSFDRSE